MRSAIQLALAAFLCTALAACETTPRNRALEPTAEDMRSALKNMLADRPDLAIPEFAESLDHEKPVEHKGIVYIGLWNCDPRLQSFEAVVSAPSVTLFEVSGRFQQDARGKWRAIPRTVQTTRGHDIGEFWRANEVDAVRY
jgi:hypothetical protein